MPLRYYTSLCLFLSCISLRLMACDESMASLNNISCIGANSYAFEFDMCFGSNSNNNCGFYLVMEDAEFVDYPDVFDSTVNPPMSIELNVGSTVDSLVWGIPPCTGTSPFIPAGIGIECYTFTVTTDGYPSYWELGGQESGGCWYTQPMPPPPIPPIDFADTLLCGSDATLLLDVSWPNATYLWQDGSTAPTFLVSEAGDYAVTVTDPCSTNSGEMEVEYQFLPTVDLGDTIFSCGGSSILLDAYFQGADYLWQDGSDANFFIAEALGWYWVEVFNDCYSVTDSVYVDLINAPSVDLGEDQLFCSGESLTLTAEVDITGGSFIWSDGSTGSSLEVTEAGTYSVEYISDCGTVSDEVSIDYGSTPFINLGEDTVACVGNNFTIVPDVDSTLPIIWSDGSNGPSLTVSSSGTYWAEVSSSCSNRDSILVDFSVCDACLYVVPNSFSPNYDGLNDDFRPFISCNPSNYTFQIYDRWGVEVFRTNDPMSTWNGFYGSTNTSAAEVGLFVWVLKFRGTDSTGTESDIVEKGQVLLLR